MDAQRVVVILGVSLVSEVAWPGGYRSRCRKICFGVVAQVFHPAMTSFQHCIQVKTSRYF